MSMHGPNHLFCSGCNLDDGPLAAAAWAGWLAAQGKFADAESWAKDAQRQLGKSMIHTPQIRVYVGEDLSAEDVHHVIETLKITVSGLERREYVKKRREEEAAAKAATEAKKSEVIAEGSDAPVK